MDQSTYHKNVRKKTFPSSSTLLSTLIETNSVVTFTIYLTQYYITLQV